MVTRKKHRTWSRLVRIQRRRNCHTIGENAHEHSHGTGYGFWWLAYDSSIPVLSTNTSETKQVCWRDTCAKMLWQQDPQLQMNRQINMIYIHNERATGRISVVELDDTLSHEINHAHKVWSLLREEMNLIPTTYGAEPVRACRLSLLPRP